MAKIGLEYARVALLNESGDAPVYTNGTKLGAAVKLDANVNMNKATLYADNVLNESITEFKDGTVSIEIDDLLDDVRVMILGHKKGEGGEITSNASDTAPYVGFGCIGKVKRKGVVKYRAIWICKVQFEEPNESSQTTGESVSFSTTSLSGTMYAVSGGDYKQEQTFDTLEEAKKYIDSKYTAATSEEEKADSE